MEEAVAACRKAIQLRPTDNATEYQNLGLVLYIQGKPEAAAVAYRKAIELKPSYADAYFKLGNSLVMQKKMAEAIAAYREAIRIQHDHVDAYTGLGVAYHEQHRTEEAAAAYLKIIQLQPNAAPAYSGLGFVLIDQNKFEEAVAACRKAIQLKPDYANAHNNLGIALASQDKLEEAVPTFRKAIVPIPGSCHSTQQPQPCSSEAEETGGGSRRLPQGHRTPARPLRSLRQPRRRLLHNQKNLGEAVAAYHKTIQLQPDDARAYFNLGVSPGREEPTGAGNHASQGPRLQPWHSEAYNNLGIVLHNQESSTGEARPFARRSSSSPTTPTHTSTSATPWGTKAKCEEAVVAYRKAVELRPNDASAHSEFNLSLQAKVAEISRRHRKTIQRQPDMPWPTATSASPCTTET